MDNDEKTFLKLDCLREAVKLSESWEEMSCSDKRAFVMATSEEIWTFINDKS